MNYRGSYKKLLGNSQAAMMAAIEIYNKPMFDYRDECTTILILNAWELILKALLSKNKNSVFYPKKRNQPYRTLTWQDALTRGKTLFPKRIHHLPIQRNLELISTYRNNAVHFYNAKDFGVVLYALAQTAIINFRDVLLQVFEIDLAERVTWQLLPVGIRPPVDVISYISGKSGAATSTATRQFLSELARAVEDVKERNQDTGRLLSIFSVKLESVKKIGDADIVVGVTKGSTQGGPLSIVRTQDPNKTHPLRQKEILSHIELLNGKKFTSHTFQAIVWKYNIKEDPRYCWMASEGVLTRYSSDILPFIRGLTAADVSASLTDYRNFVKSKSRKRKSRA